MFCPNCGQKIPDGAKFCPSCGSPLSGEVRVPQTPKQSKTAAAHLHDPKKDPSARTDGKHKSGRNLQRLTLGLVAAVLALVAVTLSVKAGLFHMGDEQGNGQSGSAVTSSKVNIPLGEANYQGRPVKSLPRPILGEAIPAYSSDVKPQVEDYTVSSDLSNVSNVNDFPRLNQGGSSGSSSGSSGAAALRSDLAQNGFVVVEGYNDEFFDLYESNRYEQIPNFVTTDSMMHTYHLYFQHLMKNTEKSYLAPELSKLSAGLSAASAKQLDDLAGTEWESAARRNLTFFSVAASLLDSGFQVDPRVASDVQAETSAITSHQGTGTCSVTGEDEDYSQYVPRGYYAGDDQLERYFRAMMWYGRINFTQKNEDLDRSALLMTLALHDSGLESWEHIYAVTGFFAGSSDDNGYYEYYPLATAVYGDDVSAASLKDQGDKWADYHGLTAQLHAPGINAIGSGESDEDKKGYRFMGQRFTLDEYVFGQLVYDQVRENSSGDKRMLPNALDVPAAMGSDEALSILEEEGQTDYAGYGDNMNALRQQTKDASEQMAGSSLYGRWLYTLNPLLDPKGAGYPAFMQSKLWQRKNLVTYLGSYTELKHDTVLYTKQIMAEMGGDSFEEKDDRGYVEPEPELYYRLSALTQATKDGLSGYGMLSAKDAENLDILISLATQLQTISQKELSNQTLSESEYELIRSYGGQLEHFWQEVNDNQYSLSSEAPAGLVADVATGDGKVLELGTGKVNEIYVVVPVDGSLRIASGAVYSFYQFEQPASNRLTDQQWQEMQGLGSNSASDPKSPEPWTSDFLATREP